jgi:hypothetical protein
LARGSHQYGNLELGMQEYALAEGEGVAEAGQCSPPSYERKKHHTITSLGRRHDERY